MASAELQTIVINGKGVTFDRDMPMGSLRKLLSAGNSGDLTSLMEGFSRFVIEWDFSGDPTDLESWDNLRRSEFNAIVSGIMEDLGEAGKG